MSKNLEEKVGVSYLEVGYCGEEAMAFRRALNTPAEKPSNSHSIRDIIIKMYH